MGERSDNVVALFVPLVEERVKGIQVGCPLRSQIGPQQGLGPTPVVETVLPAVAILRVEVHNGAVLDGDSAPAHDIVRGHPVSGGRVGAAPSEGLPGLGDRVEGCARIQVGESRA